ncbi:hypothetical protein K4K51_005763 [Colletotrichum sp. SAR 10_75]|nr:hypothetical protein K4K51_005763 [Colletotrichum sp. SAR 10_75]
MSSTAVTATTEAKRFVQGLRNNETLYQAYIDEFESSSDNAPPSVDDVTNFIKSKGYSTTLPDVNAALASVSANDLSFWQGDYNTQFFDEGSPGPRVVIQAGIVTVMGKQINNPTFKGRKLTWTDSNNPSNGQLIFESMIGLNPQSDPTSPDLQPPQEQNNGSAGIVNPYIGPQFSGLLWARGRPQPSDANIWGRMGKFPDPSASDSAVSSSQAPAQASTLPQWAGTYKVYVLDQTRQPPGLKPTTTTLTIDTSGKVTVNGATITQPSFSNDQLEWTADTGNQSNAILNMRDATVAGSNANFTGDQFSGQFWAKGDPKPAAYNWYGYVNGQSAPTSGNNAGSESASTSPGPTQGALQDMNGWAALVSLGSQAMNMYMQMKMGEAVIEFLKKGLPILWRGLKALFKGVSNLIQKFRNNAPKPTEAETELSSSKPVENGGPAEGEPTDSVDPADEPAGPETDPEVQPPVDNGPPIDPVDVQPSIEVPPVEPPIEVPPVEPPIEAPTTSVVDSVVDGLETAGEEVLEDGLF